DLSPARQAGPVRALPRSGDSGHRGSARDNERRRRGGLRRCIAGADFAPAPCSQCSSTRGSYPRDSPRPPRLLRRLALQLNVVLKTHALYQLELRLQLVHVLLFVSEDLLEQAAGDVVVRTLA